MHLKREFSLEALNLVKFERMKKFDRKNEQSREFLVRLRSRGFARLEAFGESHEKISRALDTIMPFIKYAKNKVGVYVDCGCGEAPETFYMARMGYESYGLDVFPLSIEYTKNRSNPSLYKSAVDIYELTEGATFIQQDVCEKWSVNVPLADVITAHAMVTLMEPEDMILFFKNAYKNANENCLFSVTGYPLESGYFGTWDIRGGKLQTALEDAAKQSGWKTIFVSTTNIIMTKQ